MTKSVSDFFVIVYKPSIDKQTVDKYLGYVKFYDAKESKYVPCLDGKEFYEIKPGYFADNKDIQEAVYFYIDVTDRMNK